MHDSAAVVGTPTAADQRRRPSGLHPPRRALHPRELRPVGRCLLDRFYGLSPSEILPWQSAFDFLCDMIGAQADGRLHVRRLHLFAYQASYLLLNQL